MSLATFTTEVYVPNDIFDKITFNKIGSIVMLQFNRFTRLTDPAEGTVTSGIIPEKYRPKIATNFIVPTTLNGTPMYVSVNASGKLAVRVTKAVEPNTNSYTTVLYLA